MLNTPRVHSFAQHLLPLAAAVLLTACGVKGGLYLAPNQLPNAKPPAGSEDAKAQAAAKQQAQQTIPAAALRNPATDSPAEMILDGSQF
jgi:predicted small lipoprotein YifL